MKEEDLVVNKIPREWVLLEDFNHVNDESMRKISTTSTLKNKEKPAESMVRAYRAESTDQYTTGSITTKIPLLFNGSKSWFKYEELIDDWLDLTVLDAEKRDPALKNRLVGDAEMYKGLHDRESLRAADGVKFFRDTSSLTSARELRVCCSEDFINSLEQEEATSRWSSGLGHFHCS